MKTSRNRVRNGHAKCIPWGIHMSSISRFCQTGLFPPKVGKATYIPISSVYKFLFPYISGNYGYFQNFLILSNYEFEMPPFCCFIYISMIAGMVGNFVLKSNDYLSPPFVNTMHKLHICVCYVTCFILTHGVYASGHPEC